MTDRPIEETAAFVAAVLCIVGAAGIWVSVVSLAAFVDDGFRPVFASLHTWQAVLAAMGLAGAGWGLWRVRWRSGRLLAVGLTALILLAAAMLR